MVNTAVPRRSFLSRLAAATAAFAGGAALPSTASAAPMSAKPDELEAWFLSMKGGNKAIYDCTSAASAPEGTFFAHNLIRFSAEKLGTKDSENAIVVCYRHFATPFGYNDAMWAKYPQLAGMLKVEDPGTKKPATRNWLMHELVENDPGANIPGIHEHGASFAVCGAATAFIAGLLAGDKGDAKAIAAELGANLVPGGKIVAAGVVAVQRAQKAGFAYTYAG
jgi:hypothetical protein